MNELFLIATLCAGTTNFKIELGAYSYKVAQDTAKNLNCPVFVYKFSHIETWFCKYFGHRWQTLDCYSYIEGYEGKEKYERTVVKKDTCSICFVNRKRK